MPSLLQIHGSQPQKQPKYAPIFIDRAFTGMVTQRSVLHDPSDVVTLKYYGGRPDTLWQGSNIELTNRLTLQRRSGLSPFSTAKYPTPPNRAYSFQLIDGTIRVVVDTSTVSFTVTSVDATSGGLADYHGTFTGGDSNAFAGLKFTITGFANGQNNGTFLCTASSATVLTLQNAAAVSETLAATATTYGAVYWDQQNGSKTLLFDKGVGAGQTHFIGSGGILYMGDGVDVQKWTPLNTNFPPGSSVSVWNWGTATPTVQPGVQITASGSATTVWAASTVFSTMGLVIDAFNNIWQLIDVNADPITNPNTTNAQFGTSGNGNPPWSQAAGATTTDGPITWKNGGQVDLWKPNRHYADAGFLNHAGFQAGDCAIYSPKTKAIYLNFRLSGALALSGNVEPQWGGPGWNFFESNGQNTGPHWFFFCYYDGTNPQAQPWKASHAYLLWGVAANEVPAQTVFEPFVLPPPTTGPSAGMPVYFQVATNSATSGASYAPFPNPANATITGPVSTGTQIVDGQLLWQCVSTSVGGGAVSGLWAASTKYAPWTIPGSTFGVVFDGTNMQVCISATGIGQSGTIQPGTAQSGNYTITATGGGQTADVTGATWSPAIHVGDTVKITGFTNGSNNGTFTVTAATPTQFSISTTGSNFITETHAATVALNPWGTKYNDRTTDGNLIWVCVGPPVTWAANQKWNLPLTGFAPPQQSQAFGGSTIDASNGTVQTVVVSGTSGGAAPAWALPTSTNPNTTDNTVTWFAESLTSTQSLAFVKGYAYAFSYKGRALDDFYSPLPLGGGNIPPGRDPATGGEGGALGAPTGSATNVVSSASPATIIVGSNTGAVMTISGPYSPDPQIDTIIIWRSNDGGGAGQMFELTEIPNIPGASGTWKFKDFLPDTATSQFPGLNTLIPAPVADVNNPPFATALPMAYNFQRIWLADGQFVDFSGGPDTKVGNPDEAFNPSDGLPFLAPVIRIVKTPQGLVTFLTDSIEVIGGGPLTSSFFSVTWVPAVGLMSYNALDIFAGEMYFMSADNQFRIMTPSLNVTNAGFALGDQFANHPSSGSSDATWDPAKVYVASHQSGIDNCIMVADGSTGWYRLNPRQVPGLNQGPEAIWSPFAGITSGCKMVQSVETTPGIKKLLVGSTLNNQEILYRDLTVFTDNGTPYDAWFTMGAITLAQPGQLALLKFVEFDFSHANFKPIVKYLLNEISGTFTTFTANPVFDPPSLYGDTITPGSYSPNRYYFAGNASLARCRFLQIYVDFGTTSVGDELLTMTIFGRIMVET